MHEDRNILIVCHRWSLVPAFIFHLVLCSLPPPTQPSLWYPLSLPCDSFHIFLSHSRAQAHTCALVRSLDVTDGLIKYRGWSRLVAWALIESSCLCNDCCYFINPQPMCVCVCVCMCVRERACVYLCVSVQLYTLATTHPDRQAKCTVTQQVTRPAIFRIICELAFTLNTVLPSKAAEWWGHWIHYHVQVSFSVISFMCNLVTTAQYRLYMN